jgi:hypothetical protein
LPNNLAHQINKGSLREITPPDRPPRPPDERHELLVSGISARVANLFETVEDQIEPELELIRVV